MFLIFLKEDKMKTYIEILILVFLFVVFLCGCGSGLNTVSIESDKTVNLKNYSVHSPIGDDWEYQIDDEIQSVMFYRQSDDVMKYVTGNSRNTFINVYRNQTTIPTKNIDRQEFADGYMDSEFQIMLNNANQNPYGAPILIARDTVLNNEKLLYRMNYKFVRLPAQGHLYVYLPKSFEDDGIFYLFLIGEYGGDNILSSGYDFDQINNVLATFNCIED
jgi:hypothetical protein